MVAISRKSRATNEQDGKCVSVIVPVYNVEPYIDDCMLSLRAQDYQQFEIVVVNDGSKDGSIERVRAHASLDHRIKIIEQENQGLGGARNTGVAHASGRYVVFVDSDDFVSTRFLRTLLDAQSSGNFDIVSGRHIQISESSDFLGYEHRWALPNFEPPLSDHEKVLGLFTYSVAWARLIKRHILLDNDLKFPERLPHEDLFFTYKLLRRYPNHLQLDDQIYFWRQREQSLSKAVTEDHLRVPALLRHDTYQFLDRVSATEREYILAARRNIAFLKSLRTRLEKADPGDAGVSKSFVEMVRDDVTSILHDFKTVDQASKDFSYADQGLREFVYGTVGGSAAVPTVT